MATYKCTMLINYQSGNPAGGTPRRPGGASESYYIEASTIPDVTFGVLCTARARLLPNSSSIVGMRFQSVSPVAGSVANDETRPPGSGLVQDNPQQALKIRMGGIGVTNSKSLILRMVPDVRAAFGEYDPSGPFNTNLQSFLALLRSTPWRMRVKDLTQARADIVSITDDGIVTTATAFDPTTTGQVTILRSLDANRKKRGGDFKVRDVTNSTTFRIWNWPYGDTTNGVVRKLLITYPAYGLQLSSPRLTTRKVGRPFGLYVGKAGTR